MSVQIPIPGRVNHVAVQAEAPAESCMDRKTCAKTRVAAYGALFVLGAGFCTAGVMELISAIDESRLDVRVGVTISDPPIAFEEKATIEVSAERVIAAAGLVVAGASSALVSLGALFEAGCGRVWR